MRVQGLNGAAGAATPSAARRVGGGTFQGQEIRGHPCRLFRNLGGFRFEDVTRAAGLDRLAGGAPWFYSQGAASMAMLTARDRHVEVLVTAHEEGGGLYSVGVQEWV